MPAPRRLFTALPWAAAAVLLTSGALIHAQTVQSPPAKPAVPATTSKLNAQTQPSVGPLWNQLSAQEQAALKPLATNWDGLSIGQKRKWISVSKDFNRLSPTEQTKLHTRMSEWSSLSSQQRAAARQNFAQNKELTDGLTPEQRKVQWQAYQQLSPEERRKLAESAGRPPAVAGAAPAAKPQPVLRKEPAPEFGTAKVLSKAKSSTASGKIAVAPHVQQQGAVLPGSLPAENNKP
jgi:hypothetical protein